MMDGNTHSGSTKHIVKAYMLGGFEVRVGDVTITDVLNRSQKMWNFLAYILVHRQKSIPQSKFIETLWPDDANTNPTNALKTLLYRFRSQMASVLGPDIPLVLSQRGSYSWNQNLVCTLDAEEFETLALKGADTRLTLPQRIYYHRQAFALYKGDFLPRLADQLWVIPLQAHYHSLFVSLVLDYTDILEQMHQFQEMAEVCSHAICVDQLDEHFHARMIRALLHQGKYQAAMNHYETATDLLYRNLGVRPSDELRQLYLEIMKEQKTLETDLGVIQSNLSETVALPGAFFCEFGFFKEAYRLTVRRAPRDGSCIHIALITVSRPDGGVPPLDLLNDTMEQLMGVLRASLRKGDVVSRYSGAQYVMMLPAANYEGATAIMERILGEFNRLHRRNFLKVTYKIQQVELP